MTASVQGIRPGPLHHAEAARRSVSRGLRHKGVLKQYFTSAPLARLMASMMTYGQREVRILDPGAGVGSLSAACIDRICGNAARAPRRISVTAYEMDPTLLGMLNGSLECAKERCADRGIDLTYRIEDGDFVVAAAAGRAGPGFTHVIMNPPYGKIRVDSGMHRALRGAGLPASTNTYAAFATVGCGLLQRGGQMVFISPRSFCNGAYFLPFRRYLLGRMSLKRIHLFRSRTSPFRDEGILQENVIVCAVKDASPAARRRRVTVSSSTGPGDRTVQRLAAPSEVVRGGDKHLFIHIVPEMPGTAVSAGPGRIGSTLEDLGLGVSTGKVVDFRAARHLRSDRSRTTVPLVRPFNIGAMTVTFPVKHKNHRNFIARNPESQRLLVPDGNYVLVRRFTAVEEEKRVVAAVWPEGAAGSGPVGFENRINYIHAGQKGMPPGLARGLAVFLNSSPVDLYFRQFNGSTQVNAADLRYLRYPSREDLEDLGGKHAGPASQQDIDGLVDPAVLAGGGPA